MFGLWTDQVEPFGPGNPLVSKVVNRHDGSRRRFDGGQGGPRVPVVEVEDVGRVGFDKRCDRP